MYQTRYLRAAAMPDDVPDSDQAEKPQWKHIKTRPIVVINVLLMATRKTSNLEWQLSDFQKYYASYIFSNNAGFKSGVMLRLRISISR